MHCKEFQESQVDYLTDEMPSHQRPELEEHMRQCRQCCHEFETLTGIWSRLGLLPEEKPDDRLRERFYTMLEGYQGGLEETAPAISWWQGLIRRLELNWRPAFQLGLVLLALACGWFAGSRDSAPGSMEDQHQLFQEVKQIKLELARSMLGRESAAERLQGISWSLRIGQPDDDLLDTLSAALNSDSNINVRLAAAEALFHFRENNRARVELIRALTRQESPLVQLSLIDYMVRMNEREAVEILRRLSADPDLNPAVSKVAANSLLALQRL